MNRSLPERAAALAYRALLRIYPGSFRADFARDMEETFVDRYREARSSGARAVFAFLSAAVADAVTNGLRERAHPHSFGYGMFHWMDVRYAARLLRRSPVFTLLTVVTLAGGLGLSIFTFSFLYTAMLKPLPLPAGDRIVAVQQSTPGAPFMFDVMDVAAMRPAITTLTEVGAFADADVVIGDERHRKVLAAKLAEPNIFSVTRTKPILGRAFTSEDQAVGAERVIVLSYWAWTTVFGADSTIVGRTTPLNGTFTRVIGVMPEGYGFPVAAEAWMPLGTDLLATQTPGVQFVSLYARLANDATPAQARAQLTPLLDRARRQHPPATNAPLQPASVDVLSFPMAQIGEQAPLVLAVLNLLATLILLLACINVTNLLLARANERARETAVRLALGASRGRLIVQSMWENGFICLLGGALATAIAGWGLDAINHWLQMNLPRNLAFWWVWHLDRTALLSACGFVTVTIAVLGAVVSARVVNTEFNAVLRDGTSRGGSRREGRIARALVITQVAAVTVLMFFGVMSSVVAYRVAHVDVGYDTRRLLAAALEPPRDRYPTREARAAFYERASDRLTRSASVGGVLLLAHLADPADREASARPGVASPRAYVAGVQGNLSTVGVAIRMGRAFDAGDNANGSPVAIVSEALAREHWPARSPIGERIRLAADSGITESRIVVGVASDVLMGNPFERRTALAVYVPLRQTDAPFSGVLFRHQADVASAQGDLYATLAEIDPRLLPPSVQPYEEILEKTALIARSVTKLFAMCFGFALLLAVSGTYGLMARSIGQRTREIGIRRALGATEGGLIRLLLGQGGRQLGVGVAIALPVMIAVGVGFATQFPVGYTVPIVSALGVGAAIVGVVLLATWIPTRRVLLISPREAIWRDRV
jgi:predicted permease